MTLLSPEATFGHGQNSRPRFERDFVGSAKADLFTSGVTRARAMCERNNVAVPDISVAGGLPLTGLYDGAIFVNLTKTALPAANPRVWSWPGYKVDRTAYGVVLHELGHHADLRHGRLSKLMHWKDVIGHERPVTGYEPTPAEAFAEAFRLFCSNPELLRLGRPARFAFMSLHLEPVETRTWDNVLAEAPARIQQAAARWTT